MTEYFKKSGRVKAFQLPFSFHIFDKKLDGGDWIVVDDELKNCLIITNEQFQKDYESPPRIRGVSPLEDFLKKHDHLKPYTPPDDIKPFPDWGYRD